MQYCAQRYGLIGNGAMQKCTGPNGDWDRDGIPNRFDRNPRRFDQRVNSRGGAWGDADHDSVPNRYDGAPLNPYRR